MAEELVIITWCDNEEAHPDGRVEGKPRFAGTPDLGMCRFDLCDDCNALLQRSIDLLTKYGVPEKKPRRVNPATKPQLRKYTDVLPQDTRCPICNITVYRRSSLRDHLRTTHQREDAVTIITELIGKRRTPGKLAPCPECGEKYHLGPGMTSHLKRHKERHEEERLTAQTK